MSANPDTFFGTAANDADAQETREWIEALSAVIAAMPSFGFSGRSMILRK